MTTTITPSVDVVILYIDVHAEDYFVNVLSVSTLIYVLLYLCPLIISQSLSHCPQILGVILLPLHALPRSPIAKAYTLLHPQRSHLPCNLAITSPISHVLSTKLLTKLSAPLLSRRSTSAFLFNNARVAS
jgi:hypothetical protein